MSWKRSSSHASLEDCLRKEYSRPKLALLMDSGRNSGGSSYSRRHQSPPCQVFLGFHTVQYLLIDLLLDETRLQASLSDPLYLGYLSHAVSHQLLPPFDVLTSLSKNMVDPQREHEITRYPLLRIVSQAIPMWRLSTPFTPTEITLFWNIEQILHNFVSDDVLAQDHVLFIEALNAWIRLLTSTSLYPLFRAEKDKNSGTLQESCAHSRSMAIV